MAAKIQISKDATVSVLSDTIHSALGWVRGQSASGTAAIDALSAEMLPHLKGLAVDAAGTGPKAQAAARAIDGIETIVENEIDRLGAVVLSGATSRIAQATKVAVAWLGVIVKAAVVA